MRWFLVFLLASIALSPALAQTDNLSLRLVEEETLTSLVRLGERSEDSRSDALSETAKRLLAELYATPTNRTAGIVRDLMRFQDSLTRSNELDEAVAIRNSLREFLALQEGVQPDPGSPSAFRGQNGKEFAFFVTGRKQGSVWGSGVYTDDSALSSVAVHAGLLAEGESGIVRVKIRSGQEKYEGAERNGVTSGEYGSFAGSYTVSAGPKAKSEPETLLPKAARQILTDLKEYENQKDFKARLQRGVTQMLEMQRKYARAARLDEAVALKDAAFELLVLLYDAVPVSGNFTEYRGYVGQSAYFIVKGSTAGSIWGSGTYTDDSVPGTAAVHAGLLRPGQKGIVKVTLLPGLDSYAGSHRNGVLSNSYAAWQGSYRLEAIPDK